MKRVYISGKMTGVDNHNIPAFNEAEERLKRFGCEVVNPVAFNDMFGGVSAIDESYAAARRLVAKQCEYATIEDREEDVVKAKLFNSLMDADLAAVRSCDTIYMLRGWENSNGAKRELVEAIRNGLDIMLQGENYEAKSMQEVS